MSRAIDIVRKVAPSALNDDPFDAAAARSGPQSHP
jgi:hypothetical protein